MRVELVDLALEHLELLRRWRNANRHAFFDATEVTEEGQRAWWAAYQARDSDRQFVVLVDGRPVGTLGMGTEPTHEVRRVMLGDKTFVGKGVMTQALSQLLQRYPDHPTSLQVKADQALAVRLYTALGFHVEAAGAGVLDMSRPLDHRHTLAVAATRLGYDASGIVEPAWALDEVKCLFDERECGYVQVHPSLAGTGLVEALKAYGVIVATEEVAETPPSGVVAVGPPYDRAWSHRMMAHGCCFVLVAGGVDDLGFGLRCEIEYMRGHAQPQTLAQQCAVLARASSSQHVGEAARRVVLSRAASAQLALVELQRLGRFDLGALRAHQAAHPAAADMYMWEGERELFYALLRSLRPEAAGDVLEIGIGDGGTLSVLSAFCGGRVVHAIDDFSYSQGDLQQRAVTRILEAGRSIDLITAKSSAITSWARPLSFLHVDGGHDFADADYDLRTFAPSVQVGGVLAVDDCMTRMDNPDVVQAVEGFMREFHWQWAPITCGPKVAFWRRICP